MELYLQIMMFVFGAIVGSFLNVVIYRLHTGKSVNGRSHCLSCGTPLKWYDLFPIISYLALRARCRNCGAYIPSRYLAVELLTGFTFLLLWNLFEGQYTFLVFHLILAAVLIVVAVYDVRHTIIPDELTLVVGGFAFMFLGLETYHTHDVWLLFFNVLAGAAGGLFFAGLWYISKGRWIGLGDAKLAFPLGVIVGATHVFSMVVLAFWIGALLSILVIGLQKMARYLRVRYTSRGVAKHQRCFTIKSEVPFAPFLILGFFFVQLFHADIFEITLLFLPF